MLPTVSTEIIARSSSIEVAVEVMPPSDAEEVTPAGAAPATKTASEFNTSPITTCSAQLEPGRAIVDPLSDEISRTIG